LAAEEGGIADRVNFSALLFFFRTAGGWGVAKEGPGHGFLRLLMMSSGRGAAFKALVFSGVGGDPLSWEGGNISRGQMRQTLRKGETPPRPTHNLIRGGGGFRDEGDGGEERSGCSVCPVVYWEYFGNREELRVLREEGPG